MGNVLMKWSWLIEPHARASRIPESGLDASHEMVKARRTARLSG